MNFQRNYFFLVNPFNSQVNPIDEEGVKDIDYSLSQLPSILGDGRWKLAGGLAIEGYTGRFVRSHNDIDIQIKLEDLPKIVNDANKSNYSLFRRVAMGKISPHRKLDLMCAIDENEVTSSTRHLKLIRTEKNGSPVSGRTFLDFMDIFLERGNELSLEGGKYITSSGIEVPLLDLNFLYNLKTRETSVKAHHDRKILQPLFYAE